jgi:hypothetical protein
MSLNEKQILETAKEIKDGIESTETLKELLGGDKLDNIFDLSTQEAIFDNIINNGKLHNLITDGNGLDILDGLLNNQINGNMSNFYMIKPEYILQLSPEQQKNMADSISNGRQDLSLSLQNLWSRGIRTEACTTKSSDNISMVQLNIKESEIEKQYIVQRLYEQNDIKGNAFYNYETKEFSINLTGDNLYNYLQDGNFPESQTSKENIFESAIKDSLELEEEIYSYYSPNDSGATDVRNIILAERKSLEEISRGMENYKNQISNSKSNLPAKQNILSKFINKMMAKFLKKNQNYKLKENDNTEQAENSDENYQKSNAEKDSWEIDPLYKEIINKNIVKIAEQHNQNPKTTDSTLYYSDKGE